MKDIYSPLKIFHHRQRLAHLKQGEHVYPLHVQIVPTNRCNQSCVGCAYRMEGYTSNEVFDLRSELPWSILQKTVCDCKRMGVRAIELTGGGEPTVYPQFLPLARLIQDKEIDLGLVTNGTRWTTEHTMAMATAKWVRFSIDAGCKETYASYRRASPKVFGEVHKAVEKMAATYKGCVVGVGFVVTKHNWTEIAEACRQARDLGAANFRISGLFQSQGVRYFEDFYREARELCLQAKDMETPDFRVFNLFGDRVQDLLESSPTYDFCGYSKLTCYLGADGHAYTCCNNSYNPKGDLGSFAEVGFKRLWASEALRKKLWDLDPKKCDRCMYNNKNKTILYALTEDPDHVNFL